MDDRPSPLPPRSPPVIPRAARASRFRPSPHSSPPPLDPASLRSPRPPKETPSLCRTRASSNAGVAAHRQHRGSSSVCHHRHPRSIGAGFGYVGAGTRGTFGGARGVTSSPARLSPPPPPIPGPAPAPAPASPGTAPASAPRAASHVTSPGPVTTSAYGCPLGSSGGIQRTSRATTRTRNASCLRRRSRRRPKRTRILSTLLAPSRVDHPPSSVRYGASEWSSPQPAQGSGSASAFESSSSDSDSKSESAESTRASGTISRSRSLTSAEAPGGSGMAGGGSVHASVARSSGGSSSSSPSTREGLGYEPSSPISSSAVPPRASVRVARGRDGDAVRSNVPSRRRVVVHGEHPVPRDAPSAFVFAFIFTRDG